MRLSTKSIKDLQVILTDQFGLKLSDEEAQEAGLSIMRFVSAKYIRAQELAKQNKENGNGDKTSNGQDYIPAE
jgi:hypothetical protein